MDIEFTELDYLEFTDEELEKFFNKFTYNNLQVFELILYFSNFSGNTKELVARLNKAKEKVIKDKMYDISQTKMEKNISLLDDKELDLMVGLLDEAEACSASDERYTSESIYLDYLKTIAEKEAVKYIHNKQKVIRIP